MGHNNLQFDINVSLFESLPLNLSLHKSLSLSVIYNIIFTKTKSSHLFQGNINTQQNGWMAKLIKRSSDRFYFLSQESERAQGAYGKSATPEQQCPIMPLVPWYFFDNCRITNNHNQIYYVSFPLMTMSREVTHRMCL